ncbi:MAG: GNAT family N-acetyltransferase [Christensenellales bacterium]
MVDQKADWADMPGLIEAYLGETGRRNDGFWDDGIYAAQPYMMTLGGEPAGFFAVGAWDGAPMLRAFYMPRALRYLAQEQFARVVSEFGIERAMAASNDELLLCLSFERMRETGGRFEMQAYNLTYDAPRRAAEFGADCFMRVPEDAYPAMHAESENQWYDGVIPEGAQFYRAVQGEQTLGYGAIYPRRLDKGSADVGNYVIARYRQRGVGRSILIHLANLVRASGKQPTAGCWYYNHASIRTLMSAGFVPDVRLFNVQF